MNTTIEKNGGIIDSQTHFNLDINALRSATTAYAKAYNETSYIVYGCELTTSGVNVDLAEGYIFVADEIFFVPAEQFLNTDLATIRAYTFHLAKVNVDRPTLTQGTQTVGETRVAVLEVNGVTGSNPELDTKTYIEYPLLINLLTNVDASETDKGIIQLATVAEVTAGTDAVKAVTPSTLRSVVAVDDSWIFPTLNADFINQVNSAFHLKYRKDNFGNLIITGRILTNADFTAASSHVIFTLPVEYQISNSFTGITTLIDDQIIARVYYDNSPLGKITLHSKFASTNGSAFDINLIVYK